MNSRAKARAERMQALLNDDGTITPAAQLPDGLLVQERRLEQTKKAEGILTGLKHAARQKG